LLHDEITGTDFYSLLLNFFLAFNLCFQRKMLDVDNVKEMKMMKMKHVMK